MVKNTYRGSRVRKKQYIYWKLWFYYFFNWLFIVPLTTRYYRECHCFLFGNSIFYWYIEPQQSHMRFFLIHGRYLSGRVQCSHRATSATWTIMSSIMRDICWAVSNVVTGPHPRRGQSWVQETPSIMSDICRAMSNVSPGHVRTWTIMSSGNSAYHERYLSGRIQCSHWATYRCDTKIFDWRRFKQMYFPSLSHWRAGRNLKLLLTKSC